MTEPAQQSNIGILHIRKTGGTAIKTALKAQARQAREHGVRLRFYDHVTTLKRVWELRPDEQVVFVVREPTARFVSGFNGRLRQGRPRFNTPWREQEKIAFEYFSSANQLAETLSSSVPSEICAAKLAMWSIRHVFPRLTYWLESPRFLEENTVRIATIATTETLESDQAEIARICLGKQNLALPEDQVEANRAPPGMNQYLSEQAKSNLREWYRSDFEIYQWCLDWKKRQAQESATI